MKFDPNIFKRPNFRLIAFVVLVVAIVAINLEMYIKQNHVPAAELEWVDIVSSTFNIFLIGFMLHMNVRVRNRHSIQSNFLFYGLCLLFVGFSSDVMDEFVVYSNPLLAQLAENIPNNLGIIFLALAHYYWVRSQLEKVEELERDREHLQSEAFTDQLTGLRNRRFLSDMLPAIIDKDIESGLSVSLLLIDIDDFKSLNDTYGHLEGDRVIKATGDTLHRLIRHNDHAIRYGGEEYLVVLRSDVDEAAATAERIREAYSNLVFQLPGGTTLQKTISIGLAKMQPDTAFDETLQHADDALYQAKAAGKNRVVVANTDR